MPLFGDLAGELVGRLPGLAPFLAQTFINRAYRTVREEREWSFLSTDGAVICPTMVATGAAAIVNASPTVTMSVAATAALVAGIPVIPGLTAMQIRFMGLAQTSQVYSILAAVGSPLVLTLDRPVAEPTNALSPYLVYRAYIVPPIADFIRWHSLDDMVNGIRIVRDRLSHSSVYFDIRDPQRQSLGLAYYLGFFKGAGQISSVDSTPIWELWPHSTQGQTWYVKFQRRGTDPAMTDPVPSVLPDTLIIEKALAQSAYPHCKANIGHFPAMAKVNWTQLVELSQAEYRSRLARAKISDDELSMTSVWDRGHGLKDGRWGSGGLGPIADAAYWQSHGVFW